MKIVDKLNKINNYQAYKSISKDESKKNKCIRFAIFSCIMSVVSIILTCSLFCVPLVVNLPNAWHITVSIIILLLGYILPIILLVISFSNIVFQILTNRRFVVLLSMFAFAVAISFYICIAIYTDIQILFN